MTQPPPTQQAFHLALMQAAELEHLLCCQYLYAAYSLKRFPEEYAAFRSCAKPATDRQLDAVQRWTSELLLIARQEMGHLALVCNLLVSVGASAHFQRPQFPHHSPVYEFFPTLSLRPFGQDILRDFIRFEQPDLDAPIVPLQAKPVPFPTVGTLYRSLQHAVVSLVEEMSEDDVFVGAKSNQIHSSGLLILPHWRDFHLPGNITNTQTALRALEQLLEEGEGISPEPLGESEQGYQSHDEWWEHILEECRQPDVTPSLATLHGKPCARIDHHERLKSILQEYEELIADDPSFQPVRPVVSNPYLSKFHEPSTANSHPITCDLTKQAAELFESSYELMLMMLVEYYRLPVPPTPKWSRGGVSSDTSTGHHEKQRQRLTVYQELLFQPLMTIVVRSLAEVLMLLPVDETNLEGLIQTAGPPFGMFSDTQMPRSEVDAFFCDRLQEMEDSSRQLHQLLPSDSHVLAHLPEKIQCWIVERFASLSDCLHIMKKQLGGIL